MTMNDTWGYKSYDQNWKSSENLIHNLIDIASKGGNYLLNVGPTNLGEIPPPSVERLQAVGEWMKKNSKAIYATTASPFKKLDWGRCTKVVDKGGATLYLHVFNWPTNGELLVPGLKSQATGASLLVGGRRLPVRNSPDGVVISVPAQAIDPVSTTVVLKIKGAIDVVQPEVAQNADGTMTFRPGDAITHGAVQAEGSANNQNFGYWTNPRDWVAWEFKAVKPGAYLLTTEVAAMGPSSIRVSFEGQNLVVATPNTGDYKKYQRLKLGTIKIEKLGKVTLSVHAVADGWSPVNLRTIKMVPESIPSTRFGG